MLETYLQMFAKLRTDRDRDRYPCIFGDVHHFITFSIWRGSVGSDLDYF
jgi:hypothetical protein